ncbi:GntR family transcriptional regulator [Nocardiopsis composta]|uniref:DNA-binding GntR family transcriptional regulator n=1 Tax=Nocardiopsis composta TaxID=157465 RepID=A0A7W8VCG9_9ACTN|nr:GntR family transcriptional regulator [Nocardiopsis composta]MBB5430960.1 DNA-binding GntR family transcriptional regulator [Nocardiopsis composta]
MYDVLLAQFMEGKRKAGEPLNIGALSRELDVSQTPLREALARLEHTGLVRREALKGYRVSPDLGEQEIGKLMDARLLLEPALAREAGLRTTPEFLAELAETVSLLEQAAAEADEDASALQASLTSDGDFHRLIARQSGNPFLESAYLSLTGQMQRFRPFTRRGRAGAGEAAREHRAIHDALESRDAEKAAELMAVHIGNARGRALLPRA